MENIDFQYLYRDGSNYKRRGRVVFSNPSRLETGSVNAAVCSILQQDLFLAGQVRIPEVFLFGEGQISYDDHCFHEYAAVLPTQDSPTDVLGRTIDEFLTELRAADEKGWRIFDPYDSVGSYGWMIASEWYSSL